jgi:hypothetical protein
MFNENRINMRRSLGRQRNLDAGLVCIRILCGYSYTIDPYGVEPNLPDDCQQIGREFYARAPRGKIWVWFGDLADETREKLVDKHCSTLMFPAGLGLPVRVC